MSHRLDGRRCLVTGAASGIGLAIARALLAEGGAVHGLDLDAAPADAGFAISVTDVADEGSVGAGVAAAHRALGGCDVLVNCAGVCPSGTVLTTDPQAWDRVFAVNVRGPYLTSRAVVPGMAESADGSIVHIASNYGLVGGRAAAAYSASKGAVVALTRAMALDHAADGIRVNCICPGTVETPLIRAPMARMSAEEAEAVTEDRLRRHPLGRIGRPEEIAPAAVYLASDESRFVTGIALPVDGGYIAQ